MRFAIISVTEEGKKISNNIASILENDPTTLKVDVFHKNVNKTMKTFFHDYDCWIGIMATGIMVRCICPLIKSKLNDPAVLVVGENQKHVISLLSGHMGGANYLSTKIAGLIGAVPVITTATDLNGKMGIDTLAYYYWLEIPQSHLIKDINKQLSEGGDVDLYLPTHFTFLENHPMIKRSYKIHTWDKSFIRASSSNTDLDLYPKRIVAGVGSKKGVTEEQVIFAIRSALQHLHLHIGRLDALATAEIKKDEGGIKNAAVTLDLPLEIVSLQSIKDFKHSDCTPSALVEREFGVQGVCEPSALIQAGEKSQLILKKTAFNGVTVAVAVDNS